jgi:hypothetical protein
MLLVTSQCLQIYTIAQDKRGLVPFDDKRYLLADLGPDQPNPNTHAYGHKDLAGVEHFEADMPDRIGETLIIKNREDRFLRKHRRVEKLLKAHKKATQVDDVDEDFEEMPDGDANGNLDGEQLAQAERAAASRPGAAGRLRDVIASIEGRAAVDPVQACIDRGRLRPKVSPSSKSTKPKSAGKFLLS